MFTTAFGFYNQTLPPIYSVSGNYSSASEGVTWTYSVSTTNVPNQTMYYTISGTNITASDFQNGTLSGSFSLSNGSGFFTVPTSDDGIAEGNENFVVSIRTGSTSGPVVATANSVMIIDNPVYTLTASTTNVNEGGSVTFTFNVAAFPNTQYWYTISAVNPSNVTGSDFSNGTLQGSFTTNGSGTGTFTLTLANDVATEGTESFVVQVRSGSVGGAIVRTSSIITINDTSVGAPPPSYVTNSNRLPLFGTGGATIPIAGYTTAYNAGADDANLAFTSSFNFTINSTNYSTHYIGSNTYITWGGGSNAYSSLSATNPAFNKLFLGAADNSYQRVFTQSTANYVRVRYEGNGSTGGTQGSPGIVLEVTIFNPANYGGSQVIEVLVGNHNRTGGLAGIATSSSFYTTWTMAVNTSFVLVGNSTGTSWTRYLGYVNNSGY